MLFTVAETAPELNGIPFITTRSHENIFKKIERLVKEKRRRKERRTDGNRE
jgi:hypothetical protein